MYAGDSRSYTEFFEAQIEEPVYVTLVEVGAPRGMGMVTGIQVKQGDKWISLYSDAALQNVAREYQTTKTYWSWSPSICRTHFKTRDIRIEIDTSKETGIADWNYIDYVLIIGSPSLQAAALESGTTSIFYVPFPDKNGFDSFDFSSTDCPGSLFRYSDPSTISINILPVNDLPTANEEREISSVQYLLLGQRSMNFSFPAVDVDSPSVTLRLLQLPTIGRIESLQVQPGDVVRADAEYVFTFDDADAIIAESLGARYLPEKTHFDAVTTLLYSATDDDGASQNLSLIIHVDFCPKGYGPSYKVGENSYECSPCPAGSYAAAPGTKPCTACPKGYVQPNVGQTECLACPAGSIAPDAGMLSCDACLYPTSSLGGTASCDSCAVGLYRGQNHECLPCPRGASKNIRWLNPTCCMSP